MTRFRSLVDSFSSFAIFDAGGYFQQWKMDRKLNRNMLAAIQQHSVSRSVEDWSRFWYQHWTTESSSLPEQHLFSYLQAPAIQVATTSARKYQTAFPDYAPYEYYAWTLPKVSVALNGFQLSFGSSLAAYSYRIFSRAIIDELRRSSATSGHSDWSVLLRTSPTRLKASLAHIIADHQIDDYLTAIDIFRELYPPSQSGNTRKIQEPSPEHWAEIVVIYNAHCPDNPITVEGLKECLQTTIAAIRGFAKMRSPDSLNQPIHAEQPTERIDILADSSPRPIEQLEYQEQLQDLQQTFSQTVQCLLYPAPQKTPKQQAKAEEIAQILRLFYGQSLTQTQVGQTLKMGQDIVSRRISDAKRQLLERLLLQTESPLSQTPLNPKDFKYLSRLLDPWLYQYFESCTEKETSPNEHHASR